LPIDLHMDAVVGGMKTRAHFADGYNPETLLDTLAALERLLAHNPGLGSSGRMAAPTRWAR